MTGRKSLLDEVDEELALMAAEAADDPNDPLDGLVNAADLQPERIEWLWRDYVPFDTLTIVDGDSTVGKSLTMVDLIARMSRDAPMPDGSEAEPCAIVILNKEDHWNRVTIPRLDAAGADRVGSRRISFLKGKRKGTSQWESVVLPADIDWLASMITAAKKASGLDRVMFYADPLMAVVEDRVNSHSYHETMRALEPIHRLCGDTGCAFVGVRHLTKSNPSGKAIHAGQGSTAIFSTSRMGLMVAYDPDDDDDDINARARILSVVGTNLGPRRPSLRWKIQVVPLEMQTAHGPVVAQVPTVSWLGESAITADDIALISSGDRGPGTLVKAKLHKALRAGPARHTEVWSMLEAETNASESTRWRVVGQEISSGRILKARERRQNGLVWYSLPKDADRLDTVTKEVP